ncbi:unnamed protein product [Closterium sp. NIES-64]|nr:unnamed protein product [Closterium sp. NIES-64]
MQPEKRRKMREVRGGGEGSISHARRRARRCEWRAERARMMDESSRSFPRGAGIMGPRVFLCAVTLSLLPLIPRVGAVPMRASTIDTLLIIKSSLRVTLTFENSQKRSATPSPPIHSPSLLPPLLPPLDTLLIIKSSLGVTLTTWAAGNTGCTVTSQTQQAGDWTGMICSTTGEVRQIDLENQKLTGSIPKEISKLTALNHIGLGSNLIVQRIAAVTSNLFSHLTSFPTSPLFPPHLFSHLTSFPTSPLFPPHHFSHLTSFPSSPLLPPHLVLPPSFLYLLPLVFPPAGRGLGTNLCAQPGLGTNLLVQRLAAFTSNLLPLTTLANLCVHAMAQNWLYGTIPTALIALPNLYWIKFFRNYLTGTFPAPGPALKYIDLQHNFLSGSFPPHSATYCTATSNCFSQASNCVSTATTQRTPAACSICNVTMAADPAGTGWVVPAPGSSQVLCGGGSCTPNASVPFSKGTPYTSSSPLLPMFCALIGMASGSSQAMLALKSSLGVTLSSWASVPTATVMGVVSTSASFPTASSPSLAYLCSVAGALAAPIPASAAASAWKGVECNAAGAVVKMDLGYNLFQARLLTFVSTLTALSSLKDLFLHYNWFIGSIPSSLFALPSLTGLGIFSNYLTGTIPPIPSSLVGLDVAYNFLSGSLPPHSLKFCAAENNCFSSSSPSSSCNFYGTKQRAAAECTVCGMGDAAAGNVCWDGVCTADAAAVASQGIPNGPTRPTLAMSCVGSTVVTIRSSFSSTLLALKSTLGVTHTTWVSSMPCAIDGTNPRPGQTWSGVRCDATGSVTFLDLSYQQLKGSLHADISKLTTLTHLELQYSWLYCFMPAARLALPHLTKLWAFFLSDTATTMCLIAMCLIAMCLIAMCLIAMCLIAMCLITMCLITMCLIAMCLIAVCLITMCLITMCLITMCLIAMCLIAMCLITMCLITMCLIAMCLIAVCLITMCLITMCLITMCLIAMCLIAMCLIAMCLIAMCLIAMCLIAMCLIAMCLIAMCLIAMCLITMCLITMCLIAMCLIAVCLITMCLITMCLITMCLIAMCLIAMCLIAMCLIAMCLIAMCLIAMCLIAVCLIAVCLITMCLITMCLITMCLIAMCLITMCLIAMCLIAMCLIAMCLIAMCLITMSAVSTGAAAPLSSRFLGSRVPAKAVKAVQVKGNWKAGAARATATADPSTSTYVVPDLDRADALMLYEDMVLGRTFEDMCAQMYYRGKMFGFVHLYNGQEAVSSGIIKYLRQDDYVTSTYRDHVHALSKGVSAREVMAELYGKTTGCCRGQGGSMHMFSKEQGVLGGFAFIGEGIPVAVGAAFTVKYNKEVLKHDADQVSVAFFGDGTCNNGSFYECLNMAALWKLPVIFVVENNLWAIGMSHLRSTSDPAIWKKGPAFGMPGVHVDGMDVLKVREVALEAIDRARRGDGPTLIECETYRFRGHSLADPDELRSPEEKAKYAARDPIIALKKHILETGLATEADLKAIEKKIDDVVEDAVEFADESPLPERHQLLENVFADPRGFGIGIDGTYKCENPDFTAGTAQV